MTQENKPSGSTSSSSSSETKRNKSAREIEADIGETRNALSDDIKALSDKVSPANLKQEAKQAMNEAKNVAVEKAIEVKDAAVDKAVEIKDVAVERAAEVKDTAMVKAREAADAVSETIDEVSTQARQAGDAVWSFALDNAVPLTLISIGAGWLFANRRRTRMPSMYDRDDDYLSENVVSETRPRRSAALRGRNGLKRAGDTLSRTGSRVGSSAQAAYGKAGETIGQAEEALAESARRGRDIMSQKLTRARDVSRDFAAENPLAVAFGSLLAGVGVGLLLPSTARESQWLEPSRARFRSMIGDARDAAREVGSVAQDTARQTLSTMEGHAH